MINLNTNLSSQIVQQSMSNATKLLNLSVEQMTTGYKLNHAKDNAANYSISTNMSTKISAYEVAESNTSMGLDMLTTAADSLSQIEDKLTRLRALQEQAMNGTYGEQSLKAINSEANAIVDEIERLYATTQYSGINLFGDIVPIGLIEEVLHRKTDSMQSLATVDETLSLSSGSYSISTAEELAKLATMSNNGLIGDGVEFVLANNIDMSGYSSGDGWIPIGTYNPDDSADYSRAFKGSFDGNGYSITGLNIERNAKGQGLFGLVYQGSVKNLQLQDCSITANKCAAGLVARAVESTIYNCTVSGNISAAAGRGLLCGIGINIIVDKCSVTGSVNNSPYESDVNNAGGLLGHIETSQISNSYADIKINLINGTSVGGLLGLSISSNVENCYVTGVVNPGSSYAGGFAGVLRDTDCINCYSDVEFSTTANYIGGFAMAGDNTSLTNCRVLSASPNVKGVFFGYNYNEINLENCFYNSYYLEKNIPYIKSNWGSPLIELNTQTCDKERPFEYILKSSEQRVINLTMQVGINADTSSRITVETSLDLFGLKSLRRIGLDTKKDYLSTIDKMLSTVTAKQTEYGAAQNRLMSALEEITVQRDNLVSSRSTLGDADISEVSSQYIQQQILQQASATLLATANQTPSIALGLI